MAADNRDGYSSRSWCFQSLISTYHKKEASMNTERMMMKLAREITGGRGSLIPFIFRPLFVYRPRSSEMMPWRTMDAGKPSEINIGKFVKAHNDSLEPDGVNSHVGRRYAIYGGSVVDQRTGETVATWEDRGIVRFYKDKPMFEIVGRVAANRTVDLSGTGFLSRLIEQFFHGWNLVDAKHGRAEFKSTSGDVVLISTEKKNDGRYEWKIELNREIKGRGLALDMGDAVERLEDNLPRIVRGMEKNAMDRQAVASELVKVAKLLSGRRLFGMRKMR